MTILEIKFRPPQGTVLHAYPDADAAGANKVYLEKLTSVESVEQYDVVRLPPNVPHDPTGEKMRIANNIAMRIADDWLELQSIHPSALKSRLYELAVREAGYSGVDTAAIDSTP